MHWGRAVSFLGIYKNRILFAVWPAGRPDLLKADPISLLLLRDKILHLSSYWGCTVLFLSLFHLVPVRVPSCPWLYAMFLSYLVLNFSCLDLVPDLVRSYPFHSSILSQILSCFIFVIVPSGPCPCSFLSPTLPCPVFVLSCSYFFLSCPVLDLVLSCHCPCPILSPTLSCLCPELRTEVLSMDHIVQILNWTAWPEIFSLSLLCVCMGGARPKVSLRWPDLRLNTRIKND